MSKRPWFWFPPREEKSAAEGVVIAAKHETEARERLMDAASELFYLTKDYSSLHADYQKLAEGCLCACCRRASELIAKIEGRKE